MPDKDTLTERHNHSSEFIFRFKSGVLIALRALKDTFHTRHKKFSAGNELRNEQVISFSESDLWNAGDNEQNWILTAGKVQNLRIAARKLHGIEIPGHKVFSFWKHIGIPDKRRGYVVGREIREGCIVPTIAGGLCQLSNALYDAALKAGFEIVERHKHTRVIKGSLAEQDRDATVKWNYIDLRFKSRHAFRIEVNINADKLLITFKGTQSKEEKNAITGSRIPPSKLNDCYSCGNFECFKHPDRKGEKKHSAITTYVLDERWSEYDRYIKETASTKDRFIVPLLASGRIKINRYVWTVANRSHAIPVPWTILFRALMIRAFSQTKKNIFELTLALDRQVARRMIKYIPVESTHLVISQNLLPFLWEEGVLGGRTFDVLMTRLPMEILHQRLDMAHGIHAESLTLRDFRAKASMLGLESVALTKARHIITPHQEIADIFTNKSIKLDWTFPKHTGPRPIGHKILFPASGLGRKGAYEMRQLARELDLSIVVLGNALEHRSFWNDIKTEKAGSDPFKDVGLIIYPAYVEHQPRLLLKAIASGVPVVTTTASGLSHSELLAVIRVGDYEALKNEVMKKVSALSVRRDVFQV